MNLSKNIVLAILSMSTLLNAMEQPPQATGNKDANILTDMVRHLTKSVRDIRDKSIKANPEKDTNALNALVKEIKDLTGQLQAIKTFVENAIAADPDFKNKLNNEGMPPRIIEGELELSFRYDLDAIGMMLAEGTPPYDTDELKTGTYERIMAIYERQTATYELKEAIQELTIVEYGIYNVLENLKGPQIRFNNLSKRYKNYGPFIAEEREGTYKSTIHGKRYTPQEAHVALHIAAYVIAVEEAFALAKYDGGRHLYYLLKTYVNWLPEGTHMDESVEVIKGHGSIMSITDKNGKTMLDWTKELSEKAKRLNQDKKSVFMDNAIKEFAEIEKILTKGLTKTESGEIRKMKTRSFLDLEKAKLNELGFRIEKRPMKPEEELHIKRMEALNLETKQELLETSDIAQSEFKSVKNMAQWVKEGKITLERAKNLLPTYLHNELEEMVKNK